MNAIFYPPLQCAFCMMPMWAEHSKVDGKLMKVALCVTKECPQDGKLFPYPSVDFTLVEVKLDAKPESVVRLSPLN